jgi:hypothetical protein
MPRHLFSNLSSPPHLKVTGSWAPVALPVILATSEAEMRRLKVQRQPGQIVCETPILKNPSQKRASGVAQGIGPEFKPQYHQKKKKK